MPRNNDDFISGTHSFQDPSGYVHLFHGTGENSVGTQSGSYIQISPPRTQTVDSTSLDDRDRRYYPDETYGPNRFPPEEKGQGVLFNMSHEPPKVRLMYSTKDARHTVPGLMAQADQLSNEFFSESPVNSTNLSENSINLVNRMKRVGLLRGEEVENIGNHEDWKSSHGIIQQIRESLDNRRDEDEDVREHPAGENEQLGKSLVKELGRRERAQGITPKGRRRPSGPIDKVVDKIKSQQFSLPGFEED